MARLVETYTVDDNGGRDANKSFLITEMPPMQAYKWACRVIIMLISGGWKAPEGARSMGMAGLATLTLTDLTSGINWEELEPLLDELMGCVKFIPNLQNPNVTRGLIESDIEEFTTIAKLQQSAFMLHINFIKPANP